MRSIHLSYANDGGCAYHRMFCPAMFCHEEMEAKGCHFSVGEGLPPTHDVFVIHGLPQPLVMLELATLKYRGKKIVWGLDDDMTSVPDWNPAQPKEVGLVVHSMMKDIADHIIVSTPHLATKLADVAHKVMVAPNLIDLSKFPPVNSETDPNTGEEYYTLRPESKVRVVWSGGHTHREDIEEVTDALDRVMSRYTPDQVVVIFQGMMPPSKLVKKYLYRNLWHQPATPFASYQTMLNSMNSHVYLAPLAPVEFNRSKSALRVLEGWSLCAAPVASDFGEYGSTIRPGKDGRLVTDSEGWYSALKRVIEDPEYRVTLALTGRKRVEDEFSWSNPVCRRPWIETFSKILEV